MDLLLTAIVSPKVLGVMLIIVLVGTGIMNGIVRRKYQYTPEREKQLEEMAEKESGKMAFQGSKQDGKFHSQHKE